MQSNSPTYSIGIKGIAPMSFEQHFPAVRHARVVDGEFTEDGNTSALSVKENMRAHGEISVETVDGDTHDDLSVNVFHSGNLTLKLPSHSKHRLLRHLQISLAPHARATIVIIPEGEGATEISLHAALGESSELTIVHAFTQGSSLKYSEHIELLGNDSGAHVVTLMNPNREDQFDISTLVTHRGARTRGHVRALGLLRGKSHTIYRVSADLPYGVVAPDSSEEARFVMLSGEAKVSTIPMLDIASNDVHTAHKLTIHPLGEKELFYPRSRGFDERTARDLLLSGVLSVELSCIKNEELLKELIAHISYD